MTELTVITPLLATNDLYLRETAESINKAREVFKDAGGALRWVISVDGTIGNDRVESAGQT